MVNGDKIQLAITRQTGETKVVNSWSKVLVYVDLKPYSDAVEAISKMLAKSENLCETSKPCVVVKDQLFRNYKELEMKWNQVVAVPRRTRTKRGLINIGGSLLKFLVGTLSEEDGERYEKAIISNEVRLNQTAATFKRDKRIMSSLLKFSMEESRTVNKLLTDVMVLHGVEQFNWLTHQTSLMMQSVTGKMQQLIAHLTVDNVRFHSNIVPVPEMEEALAQIAGQLAEFEELPFKQWGPSYYEITKVHLAITQRYAIYELSFPVVLRGSWMGWQVRPIPTMMEEKFYLLQMREEFLIQSASLDSVQLTAEEQKQNCRSSYGMIFCDVRKPVSVSKERTCLQQLVMGLEADRCKAVELVLKETTWFQIDDNYFMFVAPVEEMATRRCPGNLTMVKLKDVGTTKLQPKCSVSTAKTKLFARYEVTSEIHENNTWEAVSVERFENNANNVNNVRDLSNTNYLSIDGLKNLQDELLFGGENEVAVQQLQREGRLRDLVIVLVIGSSVIAVAFYMYKRLRAAKEKMEQAVNAFDRNTAIRMVESDHYPPPPPLDML